MKKLLLCASLLVSSVAWADCSLDNGQVEYGNCLFKEYKQSQAALNKAYAKANEGYDTNTKTKLATAQTLWNKYKQAQCDADEAKVGTGSGSGNQKYECLTTLTNERIKYLNNF